jgi:hypothetical protein
MGYDEPSTGRLRIPLTKYRPEVAKQLECTGLDRIMGSCPYPPNQVSVTMFAKNVRTAFCFLKRLRVLSFQSRIIITAAVFAKPAGHRR